VNAALIANVDPSVPDCAVGEAITGAALSTDTVNADELVTFAAVSVEVTVTTLDPSVVVADVISQVPLPPADPVAVPVPTRVLPK
jgi:hypothetical protein